MERKTFWLMFIALGLVADFVMPVWWALSATIPIFFVSWWSLIAATGFSSVRGGTPENYSGSYV